MNLNQLEYFVNAAEMLNFTKAAAKCFISQTAMTQQIRALEKSIGTPLFLRDKHHVELTAAGKVYLEEARIILDRSNEAIRLARLASEGETGEITVGFINGYGQSDFPRILRSYHHAYPNIKVHLVRDNMSVLMDALVKRECDVVFTVSPNHQDYPGTAHKYLKSYPVLAVLPKGHPLAALPELTYAHLRDESFIMMQPTNRPKDQMEESLLIYNRGGYLPNVVAVEKNQETLLLMISVGMGISIMPEYVVRPYMKEADLIMIPMVKADGTAETIDFEVSWNTDMSNPAVDQLLELLS